MNAKKRLVARLLALTLALGLTTSACSAAEVPVPSEAPSVSPTMQADTGFTDVSSDADYIQAVTWCKKQGLMNGTSATEFSPDATLTRAMVVTVLYRWAGQPSLDNENLGYPFADVDASAWYGMAVYWARLNGVVQGYGNNRFGTEDPITQEQLDIILRRYNGENPEWTGDPALNVPATRAQAAVAFYENLSKSSSGEQLDTPTVNDDFALIQGGTFQMGSPTNEPERSSDETQHSVTVSSFYMSKTEVSQTDYQAVMGANPSDTKGDDLPVTNLTWYEAIEYCNKLSEAAGLTPCYTVSGTTVTWNKAANGYRLPTEAEWEYAARANTTTPFNFGDYVHNSDANCYNAYGYNNDASGNWVNGSDAYLRHTVAVTQYPANAYGLYNMHGNAAEWVWDWYGEYDTQAATDPTGPEGGNAKIIRGGGWNDHPKHIRSAYRGAQPADVGLYSIGVRPVRNAEAATGQVTSAYTAQAEKKTGKTLIVYFSQTGNTEGLANLIHEMSGFDIFRLERATPYSSSSNGPVLYGEALNELRAEAVPELKAMPDLSQYDTILLGYCNWWSSIPACVRTLLTRNDLSGKTIVPFCSMGGGRFGQTISAIAKLAPNSVIKEGLEVTYSSYDRSEITAWLDAIED